MRIAALTLFCLAVLLSACSTRQPKDPPITVFSPPVPGILYPPGYKANDALPPGYTNGMGNDYTNTFAPFDPGTNLCIIPWSFLITNHIPVGGHFDNSYTFTISNLVAGAQYVVQFHSAPLTTGFWVTHAPFTASATTRNWTEFIIEGSPQGYWRAASDP